MVHKTNAVDHAVTFLLGGFRRWDAIYFLHVAEYGYTYENALAFFPLFPLLTRVTANTVLLPLQFFMNYSSSLLVAAFFVNLVLFVLSADILYRLGIRVVRSDAVAYKAAQLYCVNPASVFFSAPYSETSFALFTFAGMFMLETGSLLLSALLFSASSLARSNGLVNCAFIWYKILKDFQLEVYCKRFQTHCMSVTGLVAMIFISLGKAATISLLCWSPFLAYQYYAYRVFCNPLASYKDMPTHILNYGNNQKYKMPHAGLSNWCHQSVPMSYSYVQQNHWNVGFLGYYELKQLPNFLLALPMMCLCVYTTVYYVMWNPLYNLSLGLHDPIVQNDKKTDDAVPSITESFGIKKKSCLVYVVHMASLTVFGVLFMHIQVRCIKTNNFKCCSNVLLFRYILYLLQLTKKASMEMRLASDAIIKQRCFLAHI